ncbi:MAG: ABC transporter substrate-binding protein [Dehalococcoidales bacterium]|nr:ABC transporter substrate-binding protein [Dehalococcoidales bacterium]
MKTTTCIKKVLLVAIVMVLAIGFAGCSRNSEKPTVKIVMAPYFGSWLCTYGIVSGALASDDVNVVIDQSLAFDDQMMAGNYPIGAMNTAAFAIAGEKSLYKLKALGVYLAHTGADTTNGVAVVYVKKGSGLQSPQDLAGKRIGIPGLNSGTASTFFGLMKNQYNIEESQFTIVDGNPPQLLEFLRRGDIQAALVLGDPSVQAYASGEFDILFNVDQAFERQYGTYNPASFLAVQTEYLEENAELVKDIYELLMESRQYGEARLEELAQIYVKEFGGNADFYVNAYSTHYSVTFDSIEGKLKDSVMAIFSFVKDRGIINAISQPDELFVEW